MKILRTRMASLDKISTVLCHSLSPPSFCSLSISFSLYFTFASVVGSRSFEKTPNVAAVLFLFLSKQPGRNPKKIRLLRLRFGKKRLPPGSLMLAFRNTSFVPLETCTIALPLPLSKPWTPFQSTEAAAQLQQCLCRNTKEVHPSHPEKVSMLETRLASNEGEWESTERWLQTSNTN